MSEFWIRQDGEVDFADGDVGDWNHESIVIRDVQRSIIEKCENKFEIVHDIGYDMRKRNFVDDEYVDWNGFLQALASSYAENYIERFPDKKEIIEKTTPNKLVIAAMKEAGVKKAELECADGEGDTREFAMMYWGWKTYRDENIETWKITRSDLQAIIWGIESIADEENWSNKTLQRTVFTITVFSTGKHFDMTLRQMQKWLQTPTQLPPIDIKNFEYLSSQAIRQVRDIDLQNIHPAYKRPGVNPFGDCVDHGIKTFREFLEDEDDYSLAKESILNALSATKDALDGPLCNFKKYKNLLDINKFPAFVNLIKKNDNQGAITSAIQNARKTHLSIADLLALFRKEKKKKKFIRNWKVNG